LGVKAGMTFSGGIIDLIMFWGQDTKPWLIFPVGLCFAVVYYFGFRFAIRKWNLKTPGREDDDEHTDRTTSPVNELAAQVLEALGGKENLTNLDACITRLRISVREAGKVDKNRLKKLGASGVLEMGNHLQVIFGPKSELIKEQMKNIMSGKSVSARPEQESKAEPAKKANVSLGEFAAPMSGKLMRITDVNDPVFSQKMMGDGFAIEPVDGTVVAPADGEVVTLFTTKHALGLRTAEGHEILIHVGIDTVKLEGKGFTAYVKEGEKVTRGQKLLEADLSYLKEHAPSIVTPIVFTNLPEGAEVKVEKGEAKAGETGILSIVRKSVTVV
jgi:glucose PTS system EIICBA or EIICB component